MVNECKICVHTGSYDYQFCAEKVKNNMNTNYIATGCNRNAGKKLNHAYKN